MITFKEKPEKVQKTVTAVITVLLLCLAAVYFILLIGGRWIFGENSVFYRSLNPFSGAGDYVKWIRIISYGFFFITIGYLIRLFISWVLTFIKKGKAIFNLLSSFIKYLSVLIFIFASLRALNVDTGTLLAGIGILSLIVGLGAQPLIEDIISGLFIVFENVFDVGDIIIVDGFRGTVREIGIRTTRFEDTSGNFKIMNNSDLRTVINLTDHLTLVPCVVQIEYGESIERVEAVVKDHIEEIGAAIPDIVEGPFYKGVSELGASGVSLKFVARCEEANRFQVERDMNREFKLLFDAHGINIPFTQVVVHQPTAFNAPNEKDKAKSKEFLDSQRDNTAEASDNDYRA
ncbi:MAG: mechanosensitive ion channel family protein [Clostridia bacterium]|nr:mechanosensitive ion channel family protein [Clostridia bacterium]